jgi:Holliday junction resolvase RusA-like endonuclease
MYDLPTLKGQKLVILGQPIVKKNNQRVVMIQRAGKPSRTKLDTAAYTKWRNRAYVALARYGHVEPISEPVNLKCRFFLEHDQNVDLSNLYEGIQDVLVEAGILLDDNYKIVRSHDGSGVGIDKENPRTEIIIT